jgi:hypothetical protein
LVRLPGDVRIGPDEFAQCLDQLVAERHLTCTSAPDHEKRYAIRDALEYASICLTLLRDQQPLSRSKHTQERRTKWYGRRSTF